MKHADYSARIIRAAMDADPDNIFTEDMSIETIYSRACLRNTSDKLQSFVARELCEVLAAEEGIDSAEAARDRAVMVISTAIGELEGVLSAIVNCEVEA
jgi:hypothetical protein